MWVYPPPGNNSNSSIDDFIKLQSYMTQMLKEASEKDKKDKPKDDPKKDLVATWLKIWLLTPVIILVTNGLLLWQLTAFIHTLKDLPLK